MSEAQWAHTGNVSNWEAEAEDLEFKEIDYSEFKTSLGYVTPHLKQKTKNKGE